MFLEELGMIVHLFVHAGGAQPPQVTGWELALVSDVSHGESVSAPSKRVAYLSLFQKYLFYLFLDVWSTVFYSKLNVRIV